MYVDKYIKWKPTHFFVLCMWEIAHLDGLVVDVPADDDELSAVRGVVVRVSIVYVEGREKAKIIAIFHFFPTSSKFKKAPFQ